MEAGLTMASKVNWYENDVLLAVEGATDDILNALALWVEGEAKENMNVDTGFMRNSTYTILAGGNVPNSGWGSGKYSNKAGRSVQRNRIAQPEVPEHAAAVHSAAEYAIYQEIENPSLYPALQRARKQAKGVIQEVGRAKL